jgi:hypothetical protein
LSDVEVDAVLSQLRSERFVDCSLDQVYFTLLDEGTYITSVSSFYRILRANVEVKERRRQATHPAKSSRGLDQDAVSRRHDLHKCAAFSIAFSYVFLQAFENGASWLGWVTTQARVRNRPSRRDRPGSEAVD